MLINKIENNEKIIFLFLLLSAHLRTGIMVQIIYFILQIFIEISIIPNLFL